MESFIAPPLPHYYWVGGVAATSNAVYGEPEPWTMMMMMKKQAEREVFQVDDLFDFSHQPNDSNRGKDEDDWTGFTGFTDDKKRYNYCNDEAGLNNNKVEGGDVSLMVDDAEFKACMPAVDELEWLGNFMEDDNSSYYYHCFNFDADDATAQLRQGGVPTCTPPPTVKEKEKEKEEEEESAVIHPCRKAKLDKASKARSKRSRGDSSSIKSARTWSIGGGLVVHSAPSSSVEEESQASTCSADLSSSSSSSMGAVDSSPLLPPPPPAKKAKKGCPNEAQQQAVTRRCSHCGVDKTPQWRAGPSGPKSLCNACGVRFKSGRLFPEYRPAASPTFISHIHSNSHRQVLEIRKQKETSSFYCTTTEEKKSTTQEISKTVELGEAPFSIITTEESGSVF